jgi:hypothetical protein
LKPGHGYHFTVLRQERRRNNWENPSDSLRNRSPQTLGVSGFFSSPLFKREGDASSTRPPLKREVRKQNRPEVNSPLENDLGEVSLYLPENHGNP